MRNEILEQLPKEIQGRVRQALSAYDECSVVRENGIYSCYTMSGICSSYAEDHKVWFFSVDDVFTKEEKIENYINQFHSYPGEYRGETDYKILQMLDEKRKTAREIEREQGFYFEPYGELNENGNFEYKGIKKIKEYKNHCKMDD